MSDLGTRLRAAGGELAALRPDLVAGEPWPLSAAYGTEPEADWGPRELLAHVNEMLPYWTRQLASVAAGDGSSSVAFGRVATDEDRIGRIGRDRQRPVGELLDDIETGLAQAAEFVDGLPTGGLDRVGAHPTRGDFTVAAGFERFLVSHLAEHVMQLREILARRSHD